jgi:hypothetical protein
MSSPNPDHLSVRSIDVRTDIVDSLRLDLVGPWPGHRFARELLKEAPGRWYLTGYLVPEAAPEAQKFDPTSQEEVDAGGDAGGGGDDDSSTPEKVAQRSFLPSSLGLSLLVSAATQEIEASVSWGDYQWEDPDTKDAEPEDCGPGGPELVSHLRKACHAVCW